MLSWSSYLPLVKDESAINVTISTGMLSSSCNFNIHWIRRESNKTKDNFSFCTLENKSKIHCEVKSLEEQRPLWCLHDAIKKNSSANHKA